MTYAVIANLRLVHPEATNIQIIMTYKNQRWGFHVICRDAGFRAWTIHKGTWQKTPEKAMFVLLKLSSVMVQEKLGERREIYEKNGGEVKVGMSVSHI